MKYDLHCHSTFSDGDLNPDALLALAAERDITHLALTDHDTVSGLDEAAQAAAKHGITLVKGIELSCEWNGQLLHMLGLGIDDTSDQLLEGVATNRRLRIERAESMFIDFERHDIDLRDSVTQQVGERGVPTRPHFAQALIDQGIVKDKNQAFRHYLVRGKVGFVPMQWPEVSDVIGWISAAKGLAVLAHPMRYKFTRSKLIRLIEAMIPAGVRGLEVSTPITRPSEIDMLGQLTKQFGLLASMGSDFHSQQQPWAKLGGATELKDDLTPVWSEF
ncbi:MAG: PHP domain-containing protein [Pseudomonadota bacterium]